MKRAYPRHSAHVTADRLKDAVERWATLMDGAERDEFSHVIQILEEIGDDDDSRFGR